MTDQAVRTRVETREHGEIAFQEYFVRLQCRPSVRGFRFAGIESALPAAGVLEAIRESSAVVICPSNPWVSIAPILGVPGIGSALENKRVIAVSPIIGGRSVKGPAAKMYAELGFEASALAVAEHYRGIAADFVLDRIDAALEPRVRDLGMQTVVTNTLMMSRAGRRRLARDVLDSLGFKI
jgi:LPPG:FO 2-phospho-L-lactate transferase